jgi:hypothetical protein
MKKFILENDILPAAQRNQPLLELKFIVVFTKDCGWIHPEPI